ncbi:HAD family hydrolase [Alkalihalobacillus sp. MEB130]|uniref:HAD family hydrolase n=1 Tax=Alkalihalobacillus sp. MEB130 TaxID=2976704 RepID=UPI0028DDCC8F|nr:HAD family hydrolase [Alkalihalobacillus sp. MEB130]MDT8858939.1 HAD family hydrolase [Alkalihalobacillus sp. MEB130]
MKGYLFITDLDGTLLNSKQEISLENKKAIQEFQENGGLFTIATGRMEKAVETFVKELNIDIPMILYNGAKVVCPLSGETLMEKHLDVPSEVMQNVNELAKDEVGMLFYQDKKVYTTTKNQYIYEYEAKEKVTVEINEDVFEKPITKVLLIGECERLRSVETTIEEWNVPVDLIYSEATYLEILPKGSSKGEAVRFLKNHLNHSTIYTICIGDNLNDLSMIHEADRGIAVENAHPELKEKADHVTVHHEQHSLANVLMGLGK